VASTPKTQLQLTLHPLGQHAGKPPLVVKRQVLVIGSRDGSHIRLSSDQVSRTHALLVIDSAGVYIRDLGSRTHTLVNTKAVTEHVLRSGDRIAIGNFLFRAEIAGTPSSTPSLTNPPSPASFMIQGQSMAYPIDGRTAVIGRRSFCGPRLEHDDVSAIHAVVFQLDGQHVLRDLGSRTGTFVNGEKAHQIPLHFGDDLRVGPFYLRYIRDLDLARESSAPAAISIKTQEPLLHEPLLDEATNKVSDDATNDDGPIHLETSPEPAIVAFQPVVSPLVELSPVDGIPRGNLDDEPIEVDQPIQADASHSTPDEVIVEVVAPNPFADEISQEIQGEIHDDIVLPIGRGSSFSSAASALPLVADDLADDLMDGVAADSVDGRPADPSLEDPIELSPEFSPEFSPESIVADQSAAPLHESDKSVEEPQELAFEPSADEAPEQFSPARPILTQL